MNHVGLDKKKKATDSYNVETAGPYIERKYIVPASKVFPLKCYLEHYFSHPRKHAIGVNSTLYFDTLDFEAYQENVNGDTIGKKYA